MNRILIALLSLTAIVFYSTPAIAQQVNPSQTVPTPNSISTSGAKDLTVIPKSTREPAQISINLDTQNSIPKLSVFDTSLTIFLPRNKQTCGIFEDNTRIGATEERQLVIGCDQI